MSKHKTPLLNHYSELDGQLSSEQKVRRRAWLDATIEAMVDLPTTDDWSSGGKRTKPEAIAGLMEVLLKILDDRTPPPSVVPTWGGGVQVEWHRNGVDFEIESDPGGVIEYYFRGSNEEREGRIEDDFDRLTEYVQAVTASE